jgi:hypothetical protein
MKLASLSHKHCYNPQSRQSAKLFLQSSELGLPQPLTRRRVCPPFGSGGRSTLACDRGGGRVPIPTKGHTLWCSIFICTRTLCYNLSPKMTVGDFRGRFRLIRVVVNTLLQKSLFNNAKVWQHKESETKLRSLLEL